MAAALKLISHKLCPYVQRAVIAITEKGVPFERIDIDLANKPDWFLKISPLGKVPVLLVETGDGEVALFESNVICEYIEDTQGGAKLHPQDPLQRAQHRAWMEFGSTILGELWGLETTGDPAVFETKRKAVAAKFAQVEKTLGAGPYFAGKNFSVCDTARRCRSIQRRFLMRVLTVTQIADLIHGPTQTIRQRITWTCKIRTDHDVVLGRMLECFLRQAISRGDR